MKRYGFTFEKQDGHDANSIDLRFCIVIYTFFACILTLIYSGSRDVTLYIFLCFFYLIFAYLPEVFPKVKSYPLLGLLTVVAYHSYMDEGKMFQSLELVRTSEGRVWQYYLNVELMVIYGVYNALVAITAIYSSIPRKFKANK